jgi:hypothetical protein
MPRAAQGIARVFGLDTHTAQRFVQNLPRVVRRAASPAIAERNANALKSIGARVECRPSLPPPAHPDPELPAPNADSMADVARSLEVDRAAADAIERFRLSEGISPSMDPVAEANAANPLIPRAPPIPHDLDRMPNAILPRWSARPADTASPYSAAPPRDHSNADLPPAFGIKFLSDPPAAPARAEPEAPPSGEAHDATSTTAEHADLAHPGSTAPGTARRSPSAAPRNRTSAAPRTGAPATDARRLALAGVALVALVALLWLALK